MPQDVLLPDAGRNIAAKIGAHYYESSVLEEFGRDHVFLNVIRAALVGRRSRHFYLAVGPLKNIEPPSLQEPYLIPRPHAPPVLSSPLSVDVDFSSLIGSAAFVDVVFDVRGVPLAAHSAVLAMSSTAFCDLLSIVVLGEDLSGSVCYKTAGDADIADTVQSRACIPLDHPVFVSFVRSTFAADGSSLPARVTVSDTVSLSAFRAVLHFLYAGTLPPLMAHWCPHIHQLAELLGMAGLERAVANVSVDEDFLNVEIYRNICEERCRRTKHILLQDSMFSGTYFPLPSARQHPSYGDCLEVKT